MTRRDVHEPATLHGSGKCPPARHRHTGRAADLAEHVVPTRVVVHQVVDHPCLVGLGQQVLFELCDSTI